MTEAEIKEHFFRTRDAAAAISSRTARVDEIVRDRWRGMPTELALAAVGGYGRRELFPYSDIDLLFLIPDEKTQLAIKEPLGLAIRDLWDAGLRVSQSVHTPAECNQIDSGNAELAVSLLDRRLLAGNEALFRQVRDPKPELGRNIVALTRERHAKFQNTIYHLEPNVKDSPGGLRDLQVLRWLSKLGAGDEDVVGSSVAVLFEIRCFLHYLAGRDDNKFSFESQDEIARLHRAASPEALMRDYFRAVRGIVRLAARRLERFEAKRSSLFSQFRDKTARFSNAEFSVVNGTVFFRSSTAIPTDPGILLRLFDFIGRHDLPLSGDIEERIDRNLSLFADWVKNNPAVWKPFRDILRLPHAVRALRAMHETHALESLFPALRQMESLVIRDFYHRYTVDEHTIVAIETVLNLRTKKDDLFGDLALETNDVHLLVTALIFHDVGKAIAGESHTISSSRIARQSLVPAGMDESEIGVVCFLIEAHLIMSATMNGRDLSDPATIREVAIQTATVERLKLLTLLTYGDISAVNPAAMTPWRRQLLWNLYAETYGELTRELSEKTELVDEDADRSTRRFMEGLPPRYIRTHDRSEIAAHVRLAVDAKEIGVAVSLERKAAWVLTVIARDKPFLFASVAGSLSSFGFNILKAEAFSNSEGLAIDTFTFADPARNLDLNPDDVKQVNRTVYRAVQGEVSVEHLLARRPRVKPDLHALNGARASFNNDASPTATLLELITQDRPGLLYDVASLISRRSGNIEIVLVETEARRAIDVFYITTAGRKLTDVEAQDMADGLSEIARGL
jgi:[protein-PII] uridylyltransferase